MSSDPLTTLDLPRPLPRSVKPFHNETIASYLDRLAAANRLDSEALRSYIARDHHKAAPIPLHRLSILSGQSAQALRHALPDVSSASDHVDILPIRRRPGHHALVRFACTRCATGRGITTPVECYLRLEDVVCTRHQRWLGRGGPSARRQPSLFGQPDILLANRRHRRLLRRHGRQITEVAYLEALRICEHWHDRRAHCDDFFRLMGIFHTGQWRVLSTDPTVEAATYPQTIALTRILASHLWRELPFTGTIGVQQFTAEVQRTVASSFAWNAHSHYRYLDPLIAVFLDEASRRADPRPYIRPTSIFADGDRRNEHRQEEWRHADLG